MRSPTGARPRSVLSSERNAPPDRGVSLERTSYVTRRITLPAGLSRPGTSTERCFADCGDAGGEQTSSIGSLGDCGGRSSRGVRDGSYDGAMAKHERSVSDSVRLEDHATARVSRARNVADRIAFKESVDVSVSRTITSTRVTLLGVLLANALTVGFGVGNGIWGGFAGFGSLVLTVALIRWRRSQQLLMEAASWVLGREA